MHILIFDIGFQETVKEKKKEIWPSPMLSWIELNWLFNVTINDISVIYVTAHRCAGGLKKKYDLRSGSQRHRHFVGFFNVPVLAPTRDQPFLYGDSDTPPHLVAFYDHAGDTEVHILDLTPPGPHGGSGFWTIKFVSIRTNCFSQKLEMVM